MLEFSGLIVIDCSVITVMVVALDMLPCFAEMVVVPVAKAEARPDAEILATVVLDEVQATLLVMFTTLPSE